MEVKYVADHGLNLAFFAMTSLLDDFFLKFVPEEDQKKLKEALSKGYDLGREARELLSKEEVSYLKTMQESLNGLSTAYHENRFEPEFKELLSKLDNKFFKKFWEEEGKEECETAISMIKKNFERNKRLEKFEQFFNNPELFFEVRPIITDYGAGWYRKEDKVFVEAGTLLNDYESLTCKIIHEMAHPFCKVFNQENVKEFNVRQEPGIGYDSKIFVMNESLTRAVEAKLCDKEPSDFALTEHFYKKIKDKENFPYLY